MKVRGEIYVVSRGGDENSYIILIWACLKISPRSCSKESSTICAATNLSFCRSVVIHTTWGEKLCIHPYNWNWEEHCKSIPYWPLWYQNLRKILQMHKPTPEVKNKYERESSITKLHMIHIHTYKHIYLTPHSILWGEGRNLRYSSLAVWKMIILSNTLCRWRVRPLISIY